MVPSPPTAPGTTPGAAPARRQGDHERRCGSRDHRSHEIAAHQAQPGDLVIICAYGHCEDAEAAVYKPTLVYVDRDNRLTHTNHSMPKQAA